MKAILLHAKQAMRGGRGIALLIFNSAARRGWVVNTTPQLLYLQQTDPVPLHRRLDGLGACLDGARKCCSHWGLKPIASHYTD
jgi:hypothetical protein